MFATPALALIFSSFLTFSILNPPINRLLSSDPDGIHLQAHRVRGGRRPEHGPGVVGVRAAPVGQPGHDVRHRLQDGERLRGEGGVPGDEERDRHDRPARTAGRAHVSPRLPGPGGRADTRATRGVRCLYSMRVLYQSNCQVLGVVQIPERLEAYVVFVHHESCINITAEIGRD